MIIIMYLLTCLLACSLTYLFTYLPTAIVFSLGGSSPYTSTEKQDENKYTSTKQYKNAVQTIKTL
jgi:hypothetical protein